jgi:alkanesulfonate monooxygenase SsuD/methylene tetrahydromethanopterin reductase-like flavin-dependent oxidoreductase (luciferase family)
LTGGAPFGKGSLSVGLYMHPDLAVEAQVRTLLQQAATAEACGFDGVTLSEHHDGFPAYAPDPSLIATWILGETQRVWAGPSPLVLTLRNPRLVAEQLAWSAVRFPGRVGATLAAGYHTPDFEALGVPVPSAPADEYERALAQLSEALSVEGPLGRDPAIAAWTSAPAPLLSTANSITGARRAAVFGLGILLSTREPISRLQRVIAAYRTVGGDGSVLLAPSVWLGAPSPERVERVVDAYRNANPPWKDRAETRSPLVIGSADEIVERLAGLLDFTGADGLSLRVHPFAPPEGMAEQVAALGRELLPRLRDLSRLANGPSRVEAS